MLDYMQCIFKNKYPPFLRICNYCNNIVVTTFSIACILTPLTRGHLRFDRDSLLIPPGGLKGKMRPQWCPPLLWALFIAKKYYKVLWLVFSRLPAQNLSINSIACGMILSQSNLFSSALNFANTKFASSFITLLISLFVPMRMRA